MILLDTNVVVAVINRRSAVVEAKFRKHLLAGDEIALSSVVVFELDYGIARSARKQENMRALSRFLEVIGGVVDFDAEDAAAAGAMRAALAAAGTLIGPYDVMIAGQALRRGATLVTANTREFSRIAGLKLEDWTAG
ncbi:MAG: PIN domain-containing protein [Hyphomicrobiaceae bacterium]